METTGQTQQFSQHNNLQTKDNRIIILDNVRGLPTGDKPLCSPDYVICIVHCGKMDLLYDEKPDKLSEHVVAVIFPNHNIKAVSTSPDYLATLVSVDATILGDPMLRIISQMRHRYEPNPRIELDNHEYGVIMSQIKLMREMSSIDIPERSTLLTHQLDLLMRLISYYRNNKLHDNAPDRRVSSQFQDDLYQHFREHRDVGFYAARVYLSSKHFSTVVKNETGHSASWWIHSHVVGTAKTLLHMRRDLTVQAIADMLGFTDQSVFSRYFHRETGLYPTEFRAREQSTGLA
ncbi:MAG: AraC family transcriptional regulator [Bacteroidales bacterium]|nr:AraC family transcriptional regulator [Bacteroidales bacterium]